MTSNSCTILLNKTAILNIAFKIHSFKQYFLFLRFFLKITFPLLSLLLNKAEQILCYYKHPLEKIFGESCNIKAFPRLCLKSLYVYLIACLLPSRYLFTSLLLHQLQEKKKAFNFNR